MAVYTVHEPPLRKRQNETDPMRFTFVRDGFHFWAFVLGPLWMLRHRLWLVFTGYILVTVALQVALRAVGASTTVMVVVGLLMAWLVGLEAATLRRFTLGRRRWRNVGIVVGDDVDAVERRFFDAWFDESWDDGAARRPAPSSEVPILRSPQGIAQGSFQSSSDVIGLFPEPGASR
jgi:Protein of unknown function (DUF2628)